MPVNLFEAKPERAVGFDEVLAAVVPDDSGKALLDGLNQAGIRTLTYKKDSVSDRLEKVKQRGGGQILPKGSDILRENAALQEENASLRERVNTGGARPGAPRRARWIRRRWTGRPGS